MINKDALKDLNEMINKMSKALEFHRNYAKVAKEMYVALPISLKNKIAGLAALNNICEKVSYFYTYKDSSLFGEWLISNDKPTQTEISIAIGLLNQYRWLKYALGDVEYFIPNELSRK